ncbi:hypothetical protein SALBM311S_07291 [Streptomyces alboniger]
MPTGAPVKQSKDTGAKYTAAPVLLRPVQDPVVQRQQDRLACWIRNSALLNAAMYGPVRPGHHARTCSARTIIRTARARGSGNAWSSTRHALRSVDDCRS